MAGSDAASLKTRLETVIALARLLDRVETSPVPVGADQYRHLVRQLAAALAEPLPDAALHAILGAHPGAAELYENLHYATTGLARASLDRSIGSEMLASQAIHRAARGPRRA